MSYEVTATRKRPQVFEELSGQQFVTSTLMSSLSQSKIAHAYLFSGPRGIGKTSAARILAKALNCSTGPSATPCGSCPSCEEIASGNALDIIEIDGASNTSVNDVREIKNEVLFAPNSSRYKVYIIDEVHMLSNSAFNALLKTIEEPPPYIVFIFATTEGHRVPATIRSRCQQFHFQLIPLEVIQNKLAEAAAEQDITIDEKALFWIAKEATGSLRDAYTLFDQIAAFSQGEITLEKIQEKLGLIDSSSISSLIEYLAQGQAAEALETITSVLTQGVSVEQCIIDLTEHFRTLLFIKQGITRESLLGSRLEEFPEKVLQGFSVVQVESALEMLLETYRNIRYSINQRYDLELVISRLAQLHTRKPPEEIYHQIEALRESIRTGEPMPLQDSEPQASAEPDISADTVKESAPADETSEPSLSEADIAHLLTSLQLERPALATLLEHASWSFNGEGLVFYFDTSYGADTVRQEIKHISKKLSQTAGKDIPVSIASNQNSEEEMDEQGNDDPTVSLVQHLFRGEILPGGSHGSK